MKSDKNILVAFLLNLGFAILEFIGGTITNSVAIISDAIHDIGDALSIGISYTLERISRRRPDEKYTYGYIRYSVLGGLLTTLFLVIGSIVVIYHAIIRIQSPVEVNYEGMIILGVIGVLVNLLAVFFTRDGASINQKAVNLHMLEDVLGWIVVLIGAIIMYFTDIKIIDPLMSIGVGIFILKNALVNLKQILDLFLEKTPYGIDIEDLKNDIMKIKGVKGVHHVHVWSMDGNSNFATMHIVSDKDNVKLKVKELLHDKGIVHTTIEMEYQDEDCHDDECTVEVDTHEHHHHHHH